MLNTPQKKFEEKFLSIENNIFALMYKEHMASTVAFAKDIVRFSFVLNGASATAILAADKTGTMSIPLFFFGAGALLATIGAAFAYLYQHSVTMDWQKILLGHGGQEKPIYRILAFLFIIGSLFSFGFGGLCFVGIKLNYINL